jgi:hypothetical protein
LEDNSKAIVDNLLSLTNHVPAPNGMGGRMRSPDSRIVYAECRCGGERSQKIYISGLRDLTAERVRSDARPSS